MSPSQQEEENIFVSTVDLSGKTRVPLSQGCSELSWRHFIALSASL